MFQRLSVRKPFTVLVGALLIIVLGVVSFMNTSTDLFPSLNLPYAVVITAYPTATPEQVETEVTAPIEARMGTISGIKNVSSVSSEHISIVTLEFIDSINMDSASLEIRESLDMLTLPENAQKPTILKLNPDMMPIMVTSVYSGDMTISELSEFTKERITPAFEGIPGVASVSASGLIQNQVYISLNQDKIDALAIPGDAFNIDMVRNILAFQNISAPAGMIDENGDIYTVRVGDKFQSVEELSSLVLFDPSSLIPDMPEMPDMANMADMENMSDMGAMPEMPGFQMNLEPIRLSDVADILETDNSGESYTRVNNNPAIMLTMQKQTEFSTSDLTREIRAMMEQLTERFSEQGIEFAIMMDQGHYIDIIIDSVLNNLLIGGILAIVILLLFLRDLRPTVIVAVSIPISLMLAFAAMYFTGVTLNMISMSGLALGVGMLVDNSIVVIENIYRLRSKGVPVRHAAVEGAGQVAGAITASTLTTIAVFLPIVFTQGLTRQIFTDLGLTIAYSLLASLLIAVTVIPAASSASFYNLKQKKHKYFDAFRGGYAKLLKGALKVKWAVVAVVVALFIFSSIAVWSKGLEFFPDMGSEEISVTVALPKGAEFEDAVFIADTLTERILTNPNIGYVGADVTGGSGGSDNMLMLLGSMFMGGGNELGVSMYLQLDGESSATSAEIADFIYEQSADLDCEVDVMHGMSGDISMLTGDAISVRVSGRELDDLRDTAAEVAEIIEGVEGAVNVSDGLQRTAPEIRVRVDKDKAMSRGVVTAEVLGAVHNAVTNPEAKLNMSLSGHDYEIIIEDAKWTEPDRADIENLEFVSSSGELIKLAEIAEIYEDVGFSSIRRSDNMRFLMVSGEIADGYNVSLVNAEIERALSDYTPPEGCYIAISGESEAIDEAFNNLYLMLLLALIFIYFIMVAQFQSLLSPFIVMFTILLGFTGGFLGLLITGLSLSVVGAVGLILLTGIVINNGIVFVDCVNRLRRYEGMRKKDALVEAGRLRLRPILMTSITTIFAMIPMAFGFGQGAEVVQPMAVSVIGGLIYATFMTLFLIPVLYDLFHKDRDMTTDEDLDYEKGDDS